MRYDQVNAMLLNEFLKEHRKVEEQGRKVQEQEATIADLRYTVAKQEARIGPAPEGLRETGKANRGSGIGSSKSQRPA